MSRIFTVFQVFHIQSLIIMEVDLLSHSITNPVQGLLLFCQTLPISGLSQRFQVSG